MAKGKNRTAGKGARKPAGKARASKPVRKTQGAPRKAAAKPAGKAQATQAAKPQARGKAKASARPSAKPSAKSQAAAKPSAKSQAAAKPSAKSQATSSGKAAAKPRASAPPRPTAESVASLAEGAPLGLGPQVAGLAGRAMIVNILGDAEAYFIDFARLAPERCRELIEHHLAAFDSRKQAEGVADWPAQFVPIALLGESMPPAIRGQIDLSAPHEGVLLHHTATGALLYAASKHDDKLAIVAPDLDAISPRPSSLEDVFDPEQQSYAYEVDRSISEGFTLHEIETMMQTAGAELTLV